jgi:hypothetical protein
MPTPFTHLEIAQRLLSDEQLPPDLRQELQASIGAFLLGNIAADARVNAGTDRADTHFYSYTKPIERPPYQIMLERYPTLKRPSQPDHQAFIMGYIAHLCVDEYWALHMSTPHFYLRDWSSIEERYYMLHIILIHMDERDYLRLADWQAEALHTANPIEWLPFMSDEVLRGWQDLIYQQIDAPNKSRTLEIFGGRIHKTPDELREILDNPEIIHQRLWQHIPLDTLAEVEAGMYVYAREQMMLYWEALKATS